MQKFFVVLHENLYELNFTASLKTTLLTNITKFCCFNRILRLLLIFPKILALFETAVILVKVRIVFFST